MSGKLTIVSGGSELMNPSERIKALQRQIDADLDTMQMELINALADASNAIRALSAVCKSRPGVEALLAEIGPKVDAIGDLAVGVINKNTGGK